MEKNTDTNEYAVCRVCFRTCRLKEGEKGFCRARRMRDGEVVCENYGRITSLALDPVEKKPLALFYPGSYILSAGSYGCNFRCPYCQNYEISDAGEGDVPYKYVSPEELVDMAVSMKKHGNIGLAFTYNEPIISYEYVLDCEKLAHASGLKTVLVTNGSAGSAVWEALTDNTDAMNIDLKAFHKGFYDTISGEFETVKRNIAYAAERCHVEVTVLIIPRENDSIEEMRELSKWLASVDKNCALHISRFFPQHNMTDRPATDVALIYKLADIARENLENVYTGNC